MANEFIKIVVDWFVIFKAPDLKDKIDEGFKDIVNGIPLEGMYKKMFGFMLFSYSMNHGPASFVFCEKAAKEINVIEEMAEYAKDWINHSKQSSSI